MAKFHTGYVRGMLPFVVVSAAVLVLVGLGYVSRAPNGLGKTVSVPNDHGRQRARAPWPASVSQIIEREGEEAEERRIHDSAETEGGSFGNRAGTEEKLSVSLGNLVTEDSVATADSLEKMQHAYLEAQLRTRLQNRKRQLHRESVVASRSMDNKEYGFDTAAWSPEDRAKYYDAMKARRASLSQGRPSLRRQVRYNRPYTLGHDQAKTKDEVKRERYYELMYSIGQRPTLPPEVIDGVEKFVFFVGYPRSGHSIIGSMMDAHPNMIISHEFMLFEKFVNNPFVATMLQNKSVLFNMLYQKSCEDANSGWRSPNKIHSKGYSLEVGTPWHAKFNGSLKVIGDKSGGQTVLAYEKRRHQPFQVSLSLLRHTVNIPMHVIHVVRNPYDMIATGSLFHSRNSSKALYRLYVNGQVKQASLKGEYRDIISDSLGRVSKYVFKLAENVDEMIRTLNLTVLEIHSADFTRDPKETMTRICDFLDLPCPEDYLQACYDKAYKNQSKSRNLVAWPEDVLTYIEASLKKIPFFRRYSFEGD